MGLYFGSSNDKAFLGTVEKGSCALLSCENVTGGIYKVVHINTCVTTILSSRIHTRTIGQSESISIGAAL